jgi:hypothetical protein
MILNHNKIITEVGQMIKLQRLNKWTKKCDGIILNPRCIDIELILNKTEDHENMIMINLSSTLVRI